MRILFWNLIKLACNSKNRKHAVHDMLFGYIQFFVAFLNCVFFFCSKLARIVNIHVTAGFEKVNTFLYNFIVQRTIMFLLLVIVMVFKGNFCNFLKLMYRWINAPLKSLLRIPRFLKKITDLLSNHFVNRLQFKEGSMPFELDATPESFVCSMQSVKNPEGAVVFVKSVNILQNNDRRVYYHLQCTNTEMYWVLYCSFLSLFHYVVSNVIWVNLGRFCSIWPFSKTFRLIN